MVSAAGEPGASAFDVGTRVQDRVTILHVSGDVDLNTAPRLETAAHETLADCPATLVVDLSGVGFLASAGLSVLVRLQERAGTTDLRIVASSPATRRPLQLMGLDKELAIYTTHDDALGS